MIKNFFRYHPPKEAYHTDISSYPKENLIIPPQKVEKDIEKNLSYAKELFSYPDNGDIIIREFTISVKDKTYKAFILFCDGLTSSDSINKSLLAPFMYMRNVPPDETATLTDIIKHQILPQNQVTVTDDITQILEGVNFGMCALFVDSLKNGFSIDLKSWEHRGIQPPQNETVILGPHEAFNEILRTNTGLIRKTLNTSRLIMENMTIGKTSKTPVSIAYIKGVVNPDLLKEVKKRISGLDAEYLFTAMELQQMIEDHPYARMPQMIVTERPDKAAKELTLGKIVILVSGSPNALVLPATVFDFTKSPEDEYLRFPFAVFISIIRTIALILALFTSAVFIALTNFHQDLILTNILFPIISSRQLVPFPSIVEILLLEIAFELIKEAGVRVPNPMGPTIGIVGGLILGQAAVTAKIVSPLMIIMVAISGLASFAIPNYSLSFAFRLSRFIYIFSASIAGIPGILTAVFVNTISVFSLTSFGVPFGSPVAPRMRYGIREALFTVPLWKKEARPGFLKPRDNIKQEKISRSWRYKSRKE
ncbi:MAG: spore germination protein [Ruminococcaceae bacterium]|nr:spore germination protein [Oscillospiraceae bacterium]